MADYFIGQLEGHISGSSSKTAGNENGVFLLRIKSEKAKFYMISRRTRKHLFTGKCEKNTGKCRKMLENT